MEKKDFVIVEKPEWISWDDIRQHLIDAHAENRSNGINMTHYLWPADKIRDSLGNDGVMLVALDNKKLIGTLGFGEKYSKSWY